MNEEIKTDEQTVQPNREHKSSVFSLLFGKPEILRNLYSAIEGVELPQDVPIKINTLFNAFIKGRKNDISFIMDKRLILILEHQSLSEISDKDCYPSRNIIRVNPLNPVMAKT